ncbi:NAD(P)H-flavin reductase [Proteiniborus ethanoligenes]|uniref:NAD(P)H-flavin reductase n=1 Tax=Proteiniborus ethanoligenes TaxID=415015 RepID=A0A1H3KB73_9FIRM|nr:sulfide/dihydroorotate dehydrogenase-like FAD/NAD-binding protein [Proteiniborus ethanoligenes]SDY49452.1 NAD(P)H-flavin reductase [Proteiniborus ethanoligenes]
MHRRLECIDAGSEYCPCYLAETKNCITCSQLQGKEFCDCNWTGTCILQELTMNRNKVKKQRDYYNGGIEEFDKIGQDSFLLKLKVTKTLARQLKEPGSYVFIRDNNLPQYFDTPMSVMKSDELNGTITIVFKAVGTKTNQLKNIKDNVLIKGPYWNGVLGLSYIKKVKGENCLVLARGISQAPSLLSLEKLVKNNNHVTLILDKGSVGEIFINDYIKSMSIEIFEEDLMSEKGSVLVKHILTNKNISLIFSAGSDLLHMKIIKLIDELDIKPYLAVTNNTEICCGEGICGGCTTRLKNEGRVKPCKTQIDARKIIERRVLID